MLRATCRYAAGALLLARQPAIVQLPLRMPIPPAAVQTHPPDVNQGHGLAWTVDQQVSQPGKIHAEPPLSLHQAQAAEGKVSSRDAAAKAVQAAIPGLGCGDTEPRPDRFLAPVPSTACDRALMTRSGAVVTLGSGDTAQSVHAVNPSRDCVGTGLLPPRVEKALARDIFMACLVTGVGRVDRVLTMYEDGNVGGSVAATPLVGLHSEAADKAGAQPAGRCLGLPRLSVLGAACGKGLGGGGRQGPRLLHGGAAAAAAFHYGASLFPLVDKFIESVCCEVRRCTTVHPGSHVFPEDTADTQCGWGSAT